MEHYTKRIIETLRGECLDEVIVLNAAHLFRVVQDFLVYYHRDKPHQWVGRDSPDRKEAESGNGLVIAEKIVGGIDLVYKRAA
ncbi:MAG: hypothetical protein U0640_15375 [Phycisphaerales bacterium]